MFKGAKKKKDLRKRYNKRYKSLPLMYGRILPCQAGQAYKLCAIPGTCHYPICARHGDFA